MADGFEGLAVVNISDPVHPFEDTAVAGAWEAQDICVDGNLGHVASLFSGVEIVDVGDPLNPSQIGSYDTTGYNPKAQAAAARDSFVYVMASVFYLNNFRVVDVSDPESPVLVATAGTYNASQKIVVRDTLAYVAENYMLEIFSITNPRNWVCTSLRLFSYLA